MVGGFEDGAWGSGRESAGDAGLGPDCCHFLFCLWFYILGSWLRIGGLLSEYRILKYIGLRGSSAYDGCIMDYAYIK